MNNHPKTILTQVNGWTPVIDAIVLAHGATAALVFGRVWRYCQMRDGLCSASLGTIAGDLGMSRDTIRLAVKLLVEKGFLRDLDPGENAYAHRLQDTGKAALIGRFDAVVDDSDDHPRGNSATPRGNSATLDDSPRGNSATPSRKFRDPPRGNSATKIVLKIQEDTGKIWSEILSDLRFELPRGVFETNLAHTEILSVEGETWRIRCAPDTGNWLTSRVGEIIRRALEGYTGEAVKVQFVEG